MRSEYRIQKLEADSIRPAPVLIMMTNKKYRLSAIGPARNASRSSAHIVTRSVSGGDAGGYRLCHSSLEARMAGARMV
jgi:hypothetical protein